ncbi:Gfo/Idh/MocA family protein [Pseudomonas oryzihabitans]|uniref:Gfo/Idh/MocA family protein n=1 Tax=Pseudomonas oryzihabitans TaxID=47885 RepID=UPI00123BCAF4|nr:Gfo/Idh/MocA family oxidoreductase [Pseudomonas oryzihabitans]QEU01787.1 Gfo/Idh/MocA family oxidoreductase [Pseudomonas oryzihabitans]
MSIDGKVEKVVDRPIRLGMVGGGRGGYIGAVHRMAVRLDRRFELVAGAFSSNSEIAQLSGADLGIAADRTYTDFREMARAEAERPDGIEAVAIVTPNHLHYEACKAFLSAGIHVICDKPMTTTLADAHRLVELVESTGLVFALTQNNTGYPMVRQARAMVREGLLGNLRMIRVSYAQDWLTTLLEADGHKQASWRMDPAQAGDGGAVADIGVHAFNLVQYITGLQLQSVCADLQSFGSGRSLDDNANVLLRYEEGVRGTLWASQVAPGNNNALTVGIYGDRGGLEWNGEANDYLRYTPFGEPPRLITRSGPGANAVAAACSRMPAGHPEGYVEGFANLYADVAAAILARRAGVREIDDTFQGADAGLAGMRFITACVASHRAGAAWVDVEKDAV